MAGLRQLRSQILEEGVDGVIDEADVALLKEHIQAQGQIDWEDMKDLIEIRCQARKLCPAFEELFFPALKAHVLADGTVSLSEQFFLLKTLYADGKIDANERKFLTELRRELRQTTPEFENLYAQVMRE